VAVAVVIQKSAASTPSNPVIVDAGLASDVSEGSIAVIVKKNVVAPEAAEKIVEAVIVVIADADASLPSGAREPGLSCDVGEGAVAVVFKKLRRRSFALRPLFT
jgi:hypothetical protein